MCNRSLHFNQLSGPVPASLNKIVSNGTQVGLLQMYVTQLHDELFLCIIEVSIKMVYWQCMRHLLRIHIWIIYCCSYTINCLCIQSDFFFIKIIFILIILCFGICVGVLVTSRLNNNSLNGTLPTLNALNQLQYV